MPNWALQQPPKGQPSLTRPYRASDHDQNWSASPSEDIRSQVPTPRIGNPRSFGASRMTQRYRSYLNPPSPELVELLFLVQRADTLYSRFEDLYLGNWRPMRSTEYMRYKVCHADGNYCGASSVLARATHSDCCEKGPFPWLWICFPRVAILTETCGNNVNADFGSLNPEPSALHALRKLQVECRGWSKKMI